MFVLVLAVATAAEAQAGFNFSPPRTLSDAEATDADVVIDSQDRATVAWQAVSPDHEQRLVQTARLDAAGVPGPIQTLSSVPNFGKPKGCPCPQVAVDPQDRVTVSWQVFDGANLRIQAVQLGADGMRGPVRTLSEAGQNAWDQKLAVDFQGRATVIWSVQGSSSRVDSLRLDPAGKPGMIQTLSEPGVSPERPEVAIDRQDRATVVWGSSEGVQAVRLAADGIPESVQAVSPPGEDAGIPEVVVDSQGRATVSWWRGGGVYEVKVVRLAADGAPGPVRTLSPEGQNTLEPQIAVDPYDRVTVAWEDFGQHANAVSLGTDGSPGPVYRLSRDDRVAGSVRLAAAPGGGAVIVWSHPRVALIVPSPGECLDAEFEPQSDYVRAAFMGPAGIPEPPVAVSPLGEQSGLAQVAVDSQGRPTVAWTSFDGTYFCWEAMSRIQSSRDVEIVEVTREPPETQLAAPLSAIDTPHREDDVTLRLWGSAFVRSPRVALQAECAGDRGAICRGVLALHADIRPKRLRIRSAGNALRHNTRSVLVARGCYRLAAGRRRVLRLRLSPLGRALLNRIAPGGRIRVGPRGRGVEVHAVTMVVLGPHFKRRRGRRTTKTSLSEGHPAPHRRQPCHL
jgi:hypothetical protein